jgi:hypothetical protein
MRKANRCVCGHWPEVVLDDAGYQVECPKCGKTSGHYPRERYAIMEWNRPKDIMDMLGAEGENRVIIA